MPSSVSFAVSDVAKLAEQLWALGPHFVAGVVVGTAATVYAGILLLRVLGKRNAADRDTAD